jgi:hypothetical protein
LHTEDLVDNNEQVIQTGFIGERAETIDKQETEISVTSNKGGRENSCR